MNQEAKPRRSAVAHVGKVARLPFAVREELNRRLSRGEAEAETLAWLNSDAVAGAALRAHFADVIITPAHLATWRRGGFAEWSTREVGREHRLAPVKRGVAAAQATDAASAAQPVAQLSLAPWRVERVEVKDGGFLSLVVDGLAAELPLPDFRLLARGFVVMHGGPSRAALTIQLPGQAARVLAGATDDIVIVELARRRLYRLQRGVGAFPTQHAVPSREEAVQARWSIRVRSKWLQPKGNTPW